MKASLLFSFSLTVAFAAASPLGDRALFNRHDAARHTRIYILQSRLESPLACATSQGTSTTVPDVSNSAASFDNSATTTDSSALPAPTAADNSTRVDPGAVVNSTTLESSSRRRRFWRRIAQDDLPDVALSWQRLCLVSGGDIITNDPCVKLAGIDGINAMLVDADPCAQQDNADAMITFAKSAGVNNTEELIANAIAYRQHPRNAVDILGVVPSTPYCQRSPVNPELNGMVNEQLDGVDPGLFGSPGIPIVPFGAPGTCPFGSTPDVATCSCVNDTDANGTTPTATDNNSTSTATDTASDTSTTETSSSLIFSNAPNSTIISTAASSSATASSSDVSASIDAGSSTAPVPEISSASSASSINASVTSSASSSTGNISSATSLTPVATVTAPSATATATRSGGPNSQPDGFDGDVNDVNG